MYNSLKLQENQDAKVAKAEEDDDCRRVIIAKELAMFSFEPL